ncbi:hypothetical protein ACFL0U_01855 [Pseudomonadota bacterium]
MKIKKSNSKKKQTDKGLIPFDFSYSMEDFFDNMLKLPDLMTSKNDMLVPDIDISKTKINIKLKLSCLEWKKKT